MHHEKKRATTRWTARLLAGRLRASIPFPFRANLPRLTAAPEIFPVLCVLTLSGTRSIAVDGSGFDLAVDRRPSCQGLAPYIDTGASIMPRNTAQAAANTP